MRVKITSLGSVCGQAAQVLPGNDTEVIIPPDILDDNPGLALDMVILVRVEYAASGRLVVIKILEEEDFEESILHGRIHFFSPRRNCGSIEPEDKRGNLLFTTEDLGDDAGDPRVREGALCTYVLDSEGKVEKVRLLPQTAGFRGRLRGNDGPSPVQTTPDRDCRGQGTLGRYHFQRARMNMAATGK